MKLAVRTPWWEAVWQGDCRTCTSWKVELNGIFSIKDPMVLFFSPSVSSQMGVLLKRESWRLSLRSLPSLLSTPFLLHWLADTQRSWNSFQRLLLCQGFLEQLWSPLTSFPFMTRGGLSLISTYGVHTALLVSPHVSFKCGQTGRYGQALLIIPADELEALESSDSFPSWLPLPLPALVWGSCIFGAAQEIEHSKQEYIILLEPQEAAICGITSPPSLHSLSLARMACGMLVIPAQNSWTASPGACRPGQAGPLSWQLVPCVSSSFVTTYASVSSGTNWNK